MPELTSFQRDLLYVIAGLSEPYGVAVKDELEAYYDKQIHAGRLYPGLDTLVNKRLVQKDEVDGRTNAYNLTDRGRRELTARREWMDQYLGEIAGE
nr:helix-turn-helix transcriptional regulator [Halalkalicoccus paucihalophilus]